MGNFAILSFLATLATVLAEPIPRNWAPKETDVPLLRRQGGVPEDCTFFETPENASQDCEYFASRWDITVDTFIKWNPTLGPSCTGLEIGKEYCVERNWGEPIPGEEPTTITTSTKATEPTGNPKPSPTQAGLIESCMDFYKAVSGDSCDAIIARYGTFTFTQFKNWNPAVGDDCKGLWANTYYCVGVPGTPTAKPTTTTSTAVTGAPKPSPTQPGLIESCVRFYKAASGDTCDAIVAKHGTFTLDQFKNWNPAVGSDCKGLWADTYYCVGIPGTPTTTRRSTSTTTTTTRGNGIATPSPTQPTIASNCNKFYLVKNGENCQQIAAKNGIPIARFNDWNRSAGSNCNGLWANAYACVGVIGYIPPLTTSCASTGKTWGDNKNAAISSAVAWCDGNASSDGSGGFGTGQTKNGCFNAPLGTNKFQFSVRNDFGIGGSLSVGKCERVVKAAINNCERGGTGTLESWFFRAVVVEGRC